MNLLNNDPNFSIVLPGGCNANCDFCFAGSRPNRISLAKYLTNLEKILNTLPKEFYQISITGGEPGISPYLEHVLELISEHREKYTNILLTTNGTNLLKHKDIISKAVDHINISRHHYDSVSNKKIFKGSYDITEPYLEQCIDEYGKVGIDVSVNCVVNDFTTKEFIEKFIQFSKSIGFSAIRFRKENGTNDPVAVEKEFEEYKVLWNGESPVCKTRKRKISGIDTFWKTSVVEPDDVSGNKLFELVYMEDGNVYSDWNCKNKIDVDKLLNKPEEVNFDFLDNFTKVFSKTGRPQIPIGYRSSGRFRYGQETDTACGGSSRSSYSSCGGSSSRNSCGGSSSSCGGSSSSRC